MATESTMLLYRGADQLREVDVVTVDGGSTPQTMTGWQLAFVVRLGEVLMLSKTTGAGITIGDGAGTGDRASIDIEDTDTEAWTPGQLYRWALWRSDTGDETPLAFGKLAIIDVAALP